MEIAVRQDLPSPVGSSVSRRVDVSSAQSTPQSDNENKAEQQAKIAQQEARVIQQLKERDQEVRAHEAAHIAVGRPYVVSGPSYTYQEGPDGRNYAIGGEVHLDTSSVQGDPEATLEKAETVRRAALAPANPSPQDQSVAASATQTAAQARVEIAVQRLEEATAEESETSEEEQVNSAESINASDEFAAEENASKEDGVDALESNQVEQKQASASVVEAFNVEVSQPSTLSQFV